MRNVTTTWMRMWGAAAAVAVSATIAGPSAVAAQSHGADLVGAEWAESLEAEAAELAQDSENFLEASRLYAKAADVRAGTVEAARARAEAGRLAYYAGNPSVALKHLAAAARTAAEMGEVIVAAEVYADAAWVAMHDRRQDEAMEYRRKAERLTRSTLLSSEDRMCLQGRLADLG